MCLDMASGDPLRAKEIWENLTPEWFYRWLAWKSERGKAKIPDSVVGMYAKD